MTLRTLILLLTFSSFQFCFGQVGKDGAATISSISTINEYTTLNVDASSGTTSLSVLSSNLNANSRFVGNLQAGDLILIYQAQGATFNNKKVGTFGDIGTLSFYPAHHITMGEGGAVFTNNKIFYIF